MGKTITYEEFEQIIYEKYNGKFTTEPFVYKTESMSIKVNCPTHGLFDTTPKKMMKTIFGCRKCSLVLGNRAISWETVMSQIIEKHGDIFDFSRVDYKTKKGKIIVGCQTHGWFETSGQAMLDSEYGCVKCSPYGERTLEDFKSLCVEKFGDIYDFSRSIYKGRKEMITIGCPVHGFMDYKADYFIESKGGCGLCGYESKRVGTEQFKKDIIDKFGDIFDLTKVNYVDRKTPVLIKCVKHGWQETKPQDFIKNKYGCGVCGHEAKTFTTQEWEDIAKSIHGDKYEYPKGDYYINSDTPIKLYCKHHDYYFMTRPDSHIGKKQSGCPLKHESKGEERVRKWLERNNFEYSKQETFDECRDKGLLKFDFYLPKYNILIEFNGLQHYKGFPNGYWNGEEGFKNRKRRDKIKFDYCKDNSIPLLIIRYDEDVDTVLNNYFDM